MTKHRPEGGEGLSEKGYADLHVHTNYSDGLFTPEKVVAVAKELGLRAVAITDHDCTDGIAPAIEAGEKCGVEIIPGIEISAAMGDDEIHILGYFIDSKESAFSEKLEKMKEGRIRRMKEMIKLLHENGVNIKEEEVFAGSECGTIGRLHLARMLVTEGIVKDTKEAFDRYLGDGKPCYVKHDRLDYKDAISMIIKAGGVPVLAHPGAKGKNENISTYVKAGLRGIEASHTKHSVSVKDIYEAMAKEYGILATGGSDCHGLERGKVLMGKVTVGYDVVNKLRSESWQKDRHKAA